MKRLHHFLLLALLVLAARVAHAVPVSNVTLTPSLVDVETLVSGSSGTLISFTADNTVTSALITIALAGESGATGATVANITVPVSGAGNVSFYWNALWQIGLNQGRKDGDYQVTVTPNGTGTPVPASSNLQIRSIDIHNFSVQQSLDAGGEPTFPYTFAYALARNCYVTVDILDISGNTVRTVLSNALQQGEFNGFTSTHTILWNGLSDSGAPVPLGSYFVRFNAINTLNNDRAYQHVLETAVTSLAGAGAQSQKLFEDNVYVFPNPVRNGSAQFNVVVLRPNARVTLRIYTIDGTLVKDVDITSTLPNPWTWDVTNQAGRKLGRGLYYYVVREEDPEGTLQVTKKMAVIP